MSCTVRPDGRRRRAAFTLVELLVVIGIIALLVGLLLPALSRARESANAVKCAANMRSAGQALNLYFADNRGWLPGPHTSGLRWNSSPNLDGVFYGGDSIGVNEGGTDERTTQNMDWMSPILGKVFKLPDNDIKRLLQLFTVDLKCPTNDIVFSSYAFDDEGVAASGVSASAYSYISYSSPLTFHMWPSRESPSFLPEAWVRTGTNNHTTFPAGYAPIVTKIGNPAKKVFLVEGARYISGGNVSFNLARYQIEGGNFMSVPPYRSYQNLPFELPGTTTFNQNFNGKTGSQTNLTYAWRHRATMNLLFFDGHVERRAIRETIQAGLYLPKGTVITAATLTYDPTDVNGQVID